jgi:hypothetical protein
MDKKLIFLNSLNYICITDKNLIFLIDRNSINHDCIEKEKKRSLSTAEHVNNPWSNKKN